MAYTSSIIRRTQAVTAKRTAMRTAKWLPLWFLLPSIAILLALQVGPSLYSLYLSTTQIDPNTAKNVNVGMANFVYLFNSPTFRESLWHTAVYSVSFVTLTISLGLMLALLLNRRIKFTGFYLVLIFLPWVISDVVAGTMWRWMFQQTYGIVQVFLNPIVGSSLYTNANGAMAIVVAASVWRSLAFTTLLFLAALQTVPNEILESAALDGANRIQRFIRIIFPLIRSAFLVTVLLTSIRAINAVGLIFSITGGGPGGATQTSSYYLLRYGWEQGEIGQGAAVSVILFIVNIALTVLYIRWVGINRD
jgi:ABC-type sugar transport system permease subunit